MEAVAVRYQKKDEASAANPFLASIIKQQEEAEFEVWPENWLVFSIFCQLSTQWNIGMNGATGLRYEALYPLLDRCFSGSDEWSEAFHDIRAMESQALAISNEK